jgi:hypothetical protein
VVKDAVFWDVTSCGSCKNERFGDGGDTSVRSVGSYKSNTASHPKRQHSSL